MSAALKHRTDARPVPEDWSDEDPMTLVEFYTVFGGLYPITVSAMRTEIGRGKLGASRVGGTYYVTPASVKALFKCPVRPKARASISGGEGSRMASRSETSGSSSTERERLAQATALEVWGRPKGSSPITSRPNGPRRQKGEVIPLR